MDFLQDYILILRIIVVAAICFLGGFMVGHYRGQISRVNHLTNNYIDRLEKENETLKDGNE
jgi:hypothetical protein